MRILFVLCLTVLLACRLAALPRVQEIKSRKILKRAVLRRGAVPSRWIGRGRILFCSKGYFFLTSDFCRSIGYRGPSAVLIHLSRNKKRIISARLVACDDSPAYIRYLLRKKQMRRYTGCPVQKLLASPDRNVLDVVSGATRSCDGIYRSVVRSLKLVLSLLP